MQVITASTIWLTKQNIYEPGKMLFTKERKTIRPNKGGGWYPIQKQMSEQGTAISVSRPRWHQDMRLLVYQVAFTSDQLVLRTWTALVAQW